MIWQSAVGREREYEWKNIWGQATPAIIQMILGILHNHKETDVCHEFPNSRENIQHHSFPESRHINQLSFLVTSSLTPLLSESESLYAVEEGTVPSKSIFTSLEKGKLRRARERCLLLQLSSCQLLSVKIHAHHYLGK